MPSSPHKRTEKFNRQNQITNAADVAVSFHRILHKGDYQRRAIQRLRDTARDMHDRRNATSHQLSVAWSTFHKLLEDANLPAELRETIFGHVATIESRLKEVEDQNFTFDATQEDLDPAERTLKHTEIALYEQILWPINQTESEVNTTHETFSMLPDGQQDELIDTSVNYPSIARVPSTIQLVTKLREEVLIPLESMQMDTEQWMLGHNLKLDSEADERQANESNRDTGYIGQIPPYIEALVAGPAALEERPLAAAADRLSRFLAQHALQRNRLSTTHADYVVLQEDAQRRMAVGVALDFYSQQYLDDYPQTCNLREEELADIEAKIAVCQQVVKRGDNQVLRVSQIFFHMNQFSGISTNSRPTELAIDDGEDSEVQWGAFEALASDLWPVSSTIPYPYHIKDWMSLTMKILRTNMEFCPLVCRSGS